MRSGSSERTFSSLRRLRTFTRNTIDQERPSNTAIMYIENKTLKINFDTVINLFNVDSTRPARRLQPI